MIKLPKILPPPTVPSHLPSVVKWLSGEGAGSWFSFEAGKDLGIILIKRFSPEGRLECKGMFTSKLEFDINVWFEINYPSHCQKVTITQNSREIILVNNHY